LRRFAFGVKCEPLIGPAVTHIPMRAVGKEHADSPGLLHGERSSPDSARASWAAPGLAYAMGAIAVTSLMGGFKGLKRDTTPDPYDCVYLTELRFGVQIVDFHRVCVPAVPRTIQGGIISSGHCSTPRLTNRGSNGVRETEPRAKSSDSRNHERQHLGCPANPMSSSFSPCIQFPVGSLVPSCAHLHPFYPWRTSSSDVDAFLEEMAIGDNYSCRGVRRQGCSLPGSPFAARRSGRSKGRQVGIWS
jgi:hypothetical protein